MARHFDHYTRAPDSSKFQEMGYNCMSQYGAGATKEAAEILAQLH
jgi:hypothetical protein